MRQSSAKPEVLIVAEKDSVAKAFAEALAPGGRYSVQNFNSARFYLFHKDGALWAALGLRGHIFDFDFEEELNRSWKDVDPRVLFRVKPKRVIEDGSYDYYRALKGLGREARLVYLALDGDPEGEGIAFEVISVISRENPKAQFRRPWFSTLNPQELRKSIENAGDPNPNLAEKCFARMEVDLTIGAAFTRFLTLSVQRSAPRLLPFGRFLSYGPCQSPVLYLVVQRALEREAFKPEKFYKLAATLRAKDQKIKAEHIKGRFKEKEEAAGIFERIKGARSAAVKEMEIKSSLKHPPVPLNTVEMESRASRFLNIRPKHALDLAEELYRRGYISYPRTETEIYSPALNLREILQSFRSHPDYGRFASSILSAPLKPTRGTKDDRAHPPIHPVKPATRAEIANSLGQSAWKLYDLIVRHFLATLSPPAKLGRQKLRVEIGGEIFEAAGVLVENAGYLDIYPFEKPDEPALPILKAGEEIAVARVELKESSTEPPPYLSESELLKLMEKLHIGTDATASQHIQTNLDRGYFYIQGKRCIPTPLGKALIQAMLQHKPELVKPEVRAFIEEQISEIAAGRKRREEVVEHAKEVFFDYYEDLRRKEKEIAQALTPTISESLKLAEKKGRRRG